MKKILPLLFLAFFGLFAAGCESHGPKEQAAEKMGQDFLKAIQAGDYTTAFSYCDKEFFNTRAPDQWIEYFNDLKKTFGNFQSMHLKQKLTDNRYSGRFFMYQYATKYDNGLATEMVTMIEKINSKDPILIAGYKIDSSKLAQ